MDQEADREPETRESRGGKHESKSITCRCFPDTSSARHVTTADFLSLKQMLLSFYNELRLSVSMQRVCAACLRPGCVSATVAACLTPCLRSCLPILCRSLDPRCRSRGKSVTYASSHASCSVVRETLDVCDHSLTSRLRLVFRFRSFDHLSLSVCLSVCVAHEQRLRRKTSKLR